MRNAYLDLTNPNSLRSKIRTKRVKHLVNLIREILMIEKINSIKIADVGGSYRYWLVFPFEEFKDITFNITLINIEEKRFYETRSFNNVTFTTQVGDGCNLKEIANQEFHLSHSNSVIEHVGSWEDIKNFRDELLRIGKYFFIQTPNYWFPMEPHYFLPFIHFFPRPVHTKLLMVLKNRSFDRATSNFHENRMLSRNEFNFLFPDAHLITERFLLLPKSFIATSNVN